MFGAILKATNGSFQKSMTFCRSIYVKKVMKLLAFIFEQSSYTFLYFLYCLVVYIYCNCRDDTGQDEFTVMNMKCPIN